MKSFGVTKYDLKWQVLRASLKGQLNDNLEEKLSFVDSYFIETPSYNRWERVYNWLLGLERGFKASRNEEKIKIIQETLKYYLSVKPNQSFKEDTYDDFSSYSQDQLMTLWKDLYKTNRQWLIKGYLHKECNQFLDTLAAHLRLLNSVRFAELLLLRENSKHIKNTHKFLF